MESVSDTYFKIVFYTGLVLTAAYLLVLIRIYTGSKYKFLYLMSLMLMMSNVFAILADSFQKPWLKDLNKLNPYLYIQVTVGFLRDTLFNLAHWIFCFKYW